MVTFTELRNNLGDTFGKVAHTGQSVTVARNGKPIAVIVSMDEYATFEDWCDMQTCLKAREENNGEYMTIEEFENYLDSRGL